LLILRVLSFATEPAPPDLGNNLSYLRVHSLADAAPALQSALSVKHACVLDLRYATASDESIAALRAALAGHPAEAPLFILISPATPASVIAAINPAAPATFITLGIAGSRPSPKITVKTGAEIDRQAYDAFDTGTPIADLISGKIDKDRYDEATLVQEFKNGNTDPEPPLLPDPTKSKSLTGADKSSEPAAGVTQPLKDRVLQRALNLHQALLALRP
jgi:hypothetical protein